MVVSSPFSRGSMANAAQLSIGRLKFIPSTIPFFPLFPLPIAKRLANIASSHLGACGQAQLKYADGIGGGSCTSVIVLDPCSPTLMIFFPFCANAVALQWTGMSDVHTPVVLPPSCPSLPNSWSSSASASKLSFSPSFLECDSCCQAIRQESVRES